VEHVGVRFYVLWKMAAFYILQMFWQVWFCSPILVIFGDGVVIFVRTYGGSLLEWFATHYSNDFEVAVGSLQNGGDMFENRDMGWS
jgi:hypothetical protein